jgi:hypothetical protein
MKNILLAFDANHFSPGAFEFARRLNEMEPIFLVGTFLRAVQYANSPIGVDGTAKPFFVPLMETDEPELIEKSIIKFEELCNSNNIKYRIHKEFNEASLPALEKETRFADLMILSSETFYKNLGTDKPNEYLKYAIYDAECSILVVPEKFTFPKSNILAYDGSELSVYAIKQFKYLFPQLCKHKTLLLYVAKRPGAEIPDLSQMEEYATTGFNDLEICEVDFDPRKYLGTWISEKNGVILVAGSYGRSEFSSILKKSFISDVISEHYIPVFIAHK